MSESVATVVVAVVAAVSVSASVADGAVGVGGVPDEGDVVEEKAAEVARKQILVGSIAGVAAAAVINSPLAGRVFPVNQDEDDEEDEHDEHDPGRRLAAKNRSDPSPTAGPAPKHPTSRPTNGD